MRKQFKWTEKNLKKLEDVLKILDKLDNYKPLTLRQVYYQLVGSGKIPNNVSQYTMLSKLVKWARIDGYIDWNDIEDRIRAFHDLRGFNNKESFISKEINYFLNGYSRNLLQSQDKYIEIWIEKDALSSIFIDKARNYNIPIITCRGFSSVSFLNDFRKRVQFYNQRNKNVLMLYFGDFDPSGMEMLRAMKITLEREMNLTGIYFKRIALTKEDIEKYDLPFDPTAIKKSDTRTKKFIDEYGSYAVELDALEPKVLSDKIQNAIENEIDLDKYYMEYDNYKIEIDKLNLLRKSVISFIQTNWK